MNAWRTQLVAFVVTALLGVIYFMTMPGGAVWGDGLEFAAVVKVLGIPHPTGYPLYIMLGKVWTLIFPLGNLAWRLHLLSAIFGIGAALLLFGAVREALAVIEEWETPSQPHHWRRVLIPGGTALAWGLTPAVWQQCNVTEVYSLFAVFLHALTLLMLRNLRVRNVRVDWIIALLFGLSLTHHRLIVVIAPAVLGYFIMRLWALRKEPPRGGIAGWILLSGVAFIVGLAPLAYLPLRAAMDPAINWGDPYTPGQLLWVLRGGEYVKTMMMATGGVAWDDTLWAMVWQRLMLILQVLPGEFVPLHRVGAGATEIITFILCGLMLLGWWRSRLALRWTTPIVVILTLVLVSIYNIVDFQAYLIPIITVGWFWLAMGLVRFVGYLESIFMRRLFTYTPLVLGLLPLWLGYQFWPISDRSHDERADEWAVNVLDNIPEGSLLLTRWDGDTYALWYAQYVLGAGEGVTVFGTNFMWNEWYRGSFSEEEADRLFFENLDGPPDSAYYLCALVGGVIAPNLEEGRAIYTAFNPYESAGAHLVTLWPQIFENQYYEIAFLGHTRDPEQAGSAVGPPDSQLLPPGWADQMRRLGEPAPELYRLIDNPALNALALERFEERVAGGHRAYRNQVRLRQSTNSDPMAFGEMTP